MIQSTLAIPGRPEASGCPTNSSIPTGCLGATRCGLTWRSQNNYKESWHEELEFFSADIFAMPSRVIFAMLNVSQQPESGCPMSLVHFMKRRTDMIGLLF